jgi:hypothetical protein
MPWRVISPEADSTSYKIYVMFNPKSGGKNIPKRRQPFPETRKK